MASSTGAALCRAPIWSASAEALLTRLSSLWRSPGWNKHALTNGLQDGSPIFVGCGDTVWFDLHAIYPPGLVCGSVPHAGGQSLVHAGLERARP